MFFHRAHPRFLQPLAGDRVLVRLRAPRHPHWQIRLVAGGPAWEEAPMLPTARTRHYAYYQAEGHAAGPFRLQYYFSVRPEKSSGGPAFTILAPDNRPFVFTWSEEDIFCPPSWVPGAVFYQIFPDRFYNGDPANDPPGTQLWGGTPTRTNFFGGDLEGIRLKIPYLQKLGVTALWLNPIFKSPSNHKYDTSDYLQVDPHFGDLDTFQRLVAELHASGIRVILDGVFNHTGTSFWAFQDLLARGEASPYRDWYYVNCFPVETNPPNYACWWNFAELPKLKATNPEVREYLIKVGTYWLAAGPTDGWRLDVPNEIEPPFWREFRQEVKKVNPDAYLTGEIWHDAGSWLHGKYFDGVMNYIFRDLVIDYFARRRISLKTLDLLLGRYRLRYPEAANYCLLNLLGSHDTARIITVFQEGLANQPGHRGDYAEAVEHLRPALILQMTYPGAPMVYYGDEVGITGGPDPDCRRPMVWNPAEQDTSLLDFYCRLIQVRRRYRALQDGLFQPLLVDSRHDIYAYARRREEASMVVVLNAGDQEQAVSLAAWPAGAVPGQVWADLLGGSEVRVADDTLLHLTHLPPNSGAILVPSHQATWCP
ncbi:MAG: glycoside hydrolase family 13 protein [Clostridia bacterium]|nr:MAG: glycoside hydrolase family 13 protein [Clostridia bacterium]